MLDFGLQLMLKRFVLVDGQSKHFFSGVFTVRDHWDGWLHKSLCLPLALESGDSNTKENQRQMEAWGIRPLHSTSSSRKCSAGRNSLVVLCIFMLILSLRTKPPRQNTTVIVCFFSNLAVALQDLTFPYPKHKKQHKQGCWHCSTRLQSHTTFDTDFTHSLHICDW